MVIDRLVDREVRCRASDRHWDQHWGRDHAGTIGGGGKLEFTLIGDTVNVAARVEQLTKTTGDTILLTQQCLDALASRPPEVVDRGAHALKGANPPP